MFKGLRPNTLAGYESTWRTWRDWRVSRREDPCLCDVRSVVIYLHHLFEKGLSHNAIAVHRSMLSSTFPRVKGVKLGCDDSVTMLMRSIYNQRPPQPRLTHTWDPATVFRYARDQGPSSDLDLRALAGKTATLLSLATLLRVSELGSIKTTSIKQSGTAVLFNLLNVRKRQRTGALASFSLPLIEDELICPARCLIEYVSRTAVHRGTSDELFLSTAPPFRAVKSNTISNWIKDYLLKSGIDASFTAHSTRSAAASCAARLGMSVDQILKTANWSNASTFTRFYHRDLPDTDVVATVFTH